MAQNKNALIRYKTIDKCLQNHYRTWTLDDLIASCSDALSEYEGKQTDVSKRTVQLDLQLMRSDKLGYNAPIVAYDKKFYKYADLDYSITNIPLTENDMNVLTETVEMLKQFKDFSLFSELGGIIQRLEDKVYSEKTHQNPIIHLDKNEHLKGLQFLDLLYQSILKRICLKITYRSFKAKSENEMQVHPIILKEYNNRWFLVCKIQKHKVLYTLALDRMISIDYDLSIEYRNTPFNGDEFYKNTVGVSVVRKSDFDPVILKLRANEAPYILTKPIHHSQQVIEELLNGDIIIQLEVHLNFELEHIIMGYAESVEVIAPEKLRDNIVRRLKKNLSIYLKE